MDIHEACKILECKIDDSKDLIKKNYRKLSMKYHPDTGGSSEQFIRLNQAYKVAMAYEPKIVNSNYGSYDLNAYADYIRKEKKKQKKESKVVYVAKKLVLSITDFYDNKVITYKVSYAKGKSFKMYLKPEKEITIDAVKVVSEDNVIVTVKIKLTVSAINYVSEDYSVVVNDGVVTIYLDKSLTGVVEALNMSIDTSLVPFKIDGKGLNNKDLYVKWKVD